MWWTSYIHALYTRTMAVFPLGIVMVLILSSISKESESELEAVSMCTDSDGLDPMSVSSHSLEDDFLEDFLAAHR